MEEYYGSWMPKALQRFLIGSAVFLFVLQLLNSRSAKSGTIALLSTFLMFIILMIYIYLYLCTSKIDPQHGNLIGRLQRDCMTRLHLKNKKQRIRLLDVGCGYGSMTIGAAKMYNRAIIEGTDQWRKKRDGSLEQCQFNAKAEKVQKRTTFMMSDPLSLSYEDETFDGVMSCYYFHKCQENDKTLYIKEALRVLKNGGSFAFVDTFGQSNHYGDFEAFIAELNNMGYKEIHYIPRLKDDYDIPGYLNTKHLFKGLGMIYGIK